MSALNPKFLRPQFVLSTTFLVGTTLACCLACGGNEIRGKSVRSKDGLTYLVIDDDNGGKCGPLKVDGRLWSFPLHTAGPITPGVHKIQCGEGPGIEFEIKAKHTFHFNYWGP